MCVCGIYVWFWYQGKDGLIESAWKFPFLCNFLEQLQALKLKRCLKNFQQRKVQHLMEFYQTFREELTLFLLKLFQKIAEGGTLPNSFFKTKITLIPKPDKDIAKSYRPILLINIDTNRWWSKTVIVCTWHNTIYRKS